MLRRLRIKVLPFLLWMLVLIVCGLPMLWTVAGLAFRPAAWELLADAQSWRVHGRTLWLSVGAVLVAGVLAIGPAAWLRRGHGLRFIFTALLAAAVLALPEAAWAYGGAELLRQTFGAPAADSTMDRLRATLTTSAQIWPIPAVALAIAWARLPASVLDAADLDGARSRVIVRLLTGPMLAGLAGALLLSARQVSAYDQTGIVTTGVLVRDAYVMAVGGTLDRAAAAAAAGFPLLIGVAVIAVIAWNAFQRTTLVDGLETGGNPRRRPSAGALLPRLLSWGLVLLATILPLVALIRTAGGFKVMEAYNAYSPQLNNGLLVAGIAAGATMAMAILATLTRGRGVMVLAVSSFLLGGQLVALGLLHFLNLSLNPELTEGMQLLRTVQDAVYAAVYDTPVMSAWAPAALLAFLPLAAARTTWRGRLRELRDLANADGANGVQTAAYIVWPLAWPGLLAATAAVFALSLGETSAAVLLYPDSLVNVMMTNVHTLAYAPMAQAALLGAFTCAIAAGLATLLWTIGRMKDEGGRMKQSRFRLRFILRPSSFIVFALVLVSCDRPPPPVAVWSSLGTDDGHLIQPRGIVYSEADDVVYVVDRTARIQKFDADTGQFLLGWNMPANRYGKPVGLGIDGEGNVWVPDTHYYRVIVYRQDGTEWFRFGEQGTGPGQFIWPTDVLILEESPTLRVLVAEYGAGQMGNNDRIQLFERAADGTMQVKAQIGSFGTADGQFRRPQSIERIGDELWVADAANQRLVVFSLRDEDFGAFLRNVGAGVGDAPGEFRFPYGLDLDAEGNLLVAEFGNNRLQKIDPVTGASLGIWGSVGTRPGQLKFPWGIAFDPTRNRTIAVDSGNDRLQVVKF